MEDWKMNNIKDYDLINNFPPALKRDRSMYALGKLISEELHRTAGEIKKNVIYANIEELPEKWLDALAYDLHADWYDYDQSIEIKRKVIRDCVRVHQKLGTKEAVERAVRAQYPKSRIEEWFEYGGKPYYFRLSIELAKNMETAELMDLMEKINTCKRLTAHLEEITFKRRFAWKVFIGNAMVSLVQISVKAKKQAQEYRRTDKIHIGISKSQRIKIKF